MENFVNNTKRDYAKILSKLIIYLLCISLGFFIGLFFVLLNVVFINYSSVSDISYHLILIHVPSAKLTLMLYIIVVNLGIVYIYSRSISVFKFIHTCSQFGFMLSIITIVTGLVWAKFSWGQYWIWDIRLITVVVLSFLFALIIVVFNGVMDEKDMLYLSFYIFVGLVNLILVRFGVSWWTSIHPISSASLFKISAIQFVNLLCILTLTTLLLYLFCIFFYQWRINRIEKQFKYKHNVTTKEN